MIRVLSALSLLALCGIASAGSCYAPPAAQRQVYRVQAQAYKAQAQVHKAQAYQAPAQQQYQQQRQQRQYDYYLYVPTSHATYDGTGELLLEIKKLRQQVDQIRVAPQRVQKQRPELEPEALEEMPEAEEEPRPPRQPQPRILKQSSLGGQSLLYTRCASCHGEKAAPTRGDGVVLFSGKSFVRTPSNVRLALVEIHTDAMPRGGKRFTLAEKDQAVRELMGLPGKSAKKSV